MTTFNDLLSQNATAMDSLQGAIDAHLSAASNATQVGGIEIGDLTGVADGTIFVYRTSTGKFEPVTAFGDLSGANDGDLLKFNTANQRFEVATPQDISLAFTELSDTPSDLAGQGNKIVGVKEDESGFEFVARQTSSAAQTAGVHSVVDRFRVVDGSPVIAAGIRELRTDAPLLPDDLTGPDPRVTASSELSSSYASWKVLDGAMGGGSQWISEDRAASVSEPHWWEFTLDTPVQVGRVQISSIAANPANGLAPTSPRDYKIELFTGGSYQILADVVDSGHWVGGTIRTYTAPSAVTNVEKIKYTVTDHNSHWTNSSGVQYIAMQSMQAYSETQPSDGISQVLGGITLARKAMLKSIALDANRAYMAIGRGFEDDKIFRVDLATRAIEGEYDLDDSAIYALESQTFSGGGSFKYSLSEFSETAPMILHAAKLYVAIDNIIKVFAANTGNSITSIDCGSATKIRDVAVSAKQNKLFAVSEAGAIVVVDLSSDTVDKTLDTTDDAAFGGENVAIEVNDTNDTAYIASASRNEIVLLHTVTDSRISTISVGSKPVAISLSETLARAVICNETADTVTVINTGSNNVMATVAMSLTGSGARPVSVAIDEASDRAAVCLANYHHVATIDLTALTIEGRIATGMNPVQIAFVPLTEEFWVISDNGEITVIGRS
ncbi:MAG: hypothetical protein J7642_21345 [Cyanobacteria bacterium SBC]|nr:hypothetical protein [Cyanobacteria bacterium SBC]